MPLVSGEKVLLDAKKQKYAVPQFNVLNLEMVDAVLRIAEETSSPVIVGIVDRHFPKLDVESLVYATRKRANQLNTPVILHLDHGRTWERVMEAIRLGFTSVMFDGSLLPFEENVRITKDIVHVAHSVGVSVEAELGHVGSDKEDDTNEITSVEEALEFANRTSVDYLAISIGNTHGHYKGKGPNINFDVLEQIATIVPIPLVLHGGSETPKMDIQRAIEKGICKINIFTEFANAYLQGIVDLSKQEKIDYLDLASYGKQNVIEIVRSKFEDFNTMNQHPLVHL